MDPQVAHLANFHVIMESPISSAQLLLNFRVSVIAKMDYRQFRHFANFNLLTSPNQDRYITGLIINIAYLSFLFTH